MNTATESKTMEVKSRLSFLSLAVPIIWVIAIVAILPKYNLSALDQTEKIMIFVFIPVFTIFAIYQLLWISFGKTIFTISTNKSLSVTSGIFFFRRTKSYFINQISNVRISSEVPALKFLGLSLSNYSGSQGFHRPESKIPVICFNYNNQKVVLGLDLSSFDLETLKKWISN